MLEVNKIHLGDNLALLKQMSDNSVDSVVTDPPYGISFMGKKWDYDVPSVELWREVYRVLKPGGHMLVACGTRTQHRMAVNIEDGGFEIRDIVAWVYGSGFPKSLDVSKAIESKLLNGKTNFVSLRKTEQDGDGKKYELKGRNNGIMGDDRTYQRKTFDASTAQAKQWQGWGTALKPAMELWTLCRKPMNSTVAENVLKYGTGGLNIDGCRVATEDTWVGRKLPNAKEGVTYGGALNSSSSSSHELGRFPANFIHDGSDEVVSSFPDDGETSASRFFYTAKANKTERDMGLYFNEEQRRADRNKDDGVGGDNLRNRTNNPRKNFHPTVKPLDLMRYLCRLITPPNGIVLDPYLGSGTTAVAAKLEGFQYIGMEQEPDYVDIAVGRVAECDRDYETKAEMLAGENVKEIFDIFDFIEG